MLSILRQIIMKVTPDLDYAIQFRRTEILHTQIRPINPQTWLGAFNINQAIEVTGGQRVLYVSGQTSNDANGAPMHAGDLARSSSLRGRIWSKSSPPRI
jgi:hypothetical protein